MFVLQGLYCLSAACIINMDIHTFSLSVKIQYHVMITLMTIMKNIYTHHLLYDPCTDVHCFTSD